ncbi:hypothetical protein QJQ45_021823 [Haematococcus lacustris]|nr:hypothetical protein QJQ45_021823 [Haematococcus lacustris]
MSLVAQCLRGSGPVPRSKSRFRLKARENKVIKVPGGAVQRGCKKTKRKLMAHFQLRVGVHSQLRVIAPRIAPGTDQRRGRVVLVDEHRTTRVSSAVNGQQPSWSQLRDQPVRGMMWCPVVAPRKPPQAPGSSQEASQAAASEPGPSTPLPAKRSKRTKAEPEAAEPSRPQGQGGQGLR